VLASRSPQRRAILRQLGIDFDVRATDVEELSDGDPIEVARENARRKAEAAGGGPDVLAVDTLVALDGMIFGKPHDEAAARATLQALSGVTHEVISGLALGDVLITETTRVTFRELDEALLDWYVATGEWRERAGGYAIQGHGAVLVRAIEGDYLNVVGLPAAALLDLLMA